MHVEDDQPGEVPEGAAVFPEIPADLGIDPLWLALLPAIVFLSGSDEQVVQPDAAEEALHGIVAYLHRLEERQLQRVREDMNCLVFHTFGIFM